MTRVLVLACAYLAVQAGALSLTQSGDWGLGWIPFDQAKPFAPYVLRAYRCWFRSALERGPEIALAWLPPIKGMAAPWPGSSAWQ